MTTTPGTTDDGAVREAVAEAVLGVPGLREALEHDPDAYLRLVATSRAAAEEAGRLLRESVAGARAAGHSWDTLGRLLGVSRQAAQQRFGGGTAPGSAAPDGPDGAPRRVLGPVTAFDEMAALAHAGRHGWHSVGYGTLHHVLEASDVQWEHRRVPWSPVRGRQRLEAEGWRLVGGSTFPWGYWARPLDVPAEPEHGVR